MEMGRVEYPPLLVDPIVCNQWNSLYPTAAGSIASTLDTNSSSWAA